MRPEIIGRTLGIGLRIAGRIAGQQLTARAQSAGNAPQPQPVADPAIRGRAVGHAARRTTGGVAKGIGGFLKPFRRVGGILWLEVTGVFFLLPVIVFSPKLWQIRASYAGGPEQRTFWVTALVIVVFLYLGVTSFWRARKK